MKPIYDLIKDIADLYRNHEPEEDIISDQLRRVTDDLEKTKEALREQKEMNKQYREIIDELLRRKF